MHHRNDDVVVDDNNWNNKRNNKNYDNIIIFTLEIVLQLILSSDIFVETTILILKNLILISV